MTGCHEIKARGNLVNQAVIENRTSDNPPTIHRTLFSKIKAFLFTDLIEPSSPVSVLLIYHYFYFLFYHPLIPTRLYCIRDEQSDRGVRTKRYGIWPAVGVIINSYDPFRRCQFSNCLSINILLEVLVWLSVRDFVNYLKSLVICLLKMDLRN